MIKDTVVGDTGLEDTLEVEDMLVELDGVVMTLELVAEVGEPLVVELLLGAVLVVERFGEAIVEMVLVDGIVEVEVLQSKN